MVQEQNHAKTELEWMLNRNIFTKIISKFQFQPEMDLLGSRLNGVRVTVLPDIALAQTLCILMLFQNHRRIDPSIHFLPLLQLESCYIK